MAGLLNGSNNSGNTVNNGVVGGSPLNQSVNSQPFSTQQDGFSVPPIANADASGLPSSKVQSLRPGTETRNIIHWFVPEVGVVNMYVNPQNISYQLKKLIRPERTKGGYVVQYWGEELNAITLSGHTGSSGIEGLNVLKEIYRSEQLLFDPLALAMQASNSVSGVNDLVDGVIGNLGSLGQTLSTATSGVLGLDPLSQNILPQNVPSLASMALGIEMYYAGAVYRGFFTSFRFDESTDRLGLYQYTIEFMVTQVRGYRLNTFAWQRSANSGPSNNSVGGVPLSYAG